MRSFMFLLLTPLALLAQKPQNYTVVTGELTQKIISTQTSGQPMRLAVVPFTGTRSSVQTSVTFGEYLTETIIGSLTGHGEKIKLFERTRLDAILKEHEFILTDLMKPAAALKIGQLVPIDALLSGTYTKLKSYVDVSARVIDVASGEITASYTGRIKMNKNLAALFPENEGAPSTVNTSPGGNPQNVNVNISNPNTSTATPSKSKGDLCKQKVEEFKSRLNDLSTVEKINNVVTEAKKTPFDNLCGQLHYHVIYSFMRFNIQNTEYKDFLLLTLDTIAYPTGDERALEIVRFLSSDNDVDDREWRTGLGALSRVGNYSLSTYISYLISKPKAATEKIVQRRIEDYFTLASNGKIGLPTAISLDAAFFEMMEGIHGSQPLRQYVYDTYADRIKTDDKSSAALFSLLHSIYKEENQPARKGEVMGWIIDFVNTHEYPKAHEQLFDFAFAFQLTLNEHRNEEIRREFHEEDLKLLTQRCQEKFSKYALMSPYESQEEDRVDFCVRYNIPIPGVIPSMEEAEIILKGNNIDELFRVMQLLTLMEDRPNKIENAVIGLFSKRSLEDRGKLMEIQVLAIVVLGNVKTSNAKAVEFMIGTLPNYGNDTEASQVALVKIGKPAVPALISKLDKTTEMDGGLQYQLITLLGKIGKDAAPAERSIQRILNGSRNSDVRYAAEAALLAIR